MSRPPSAFPSTVATPAPSSPPRSGSFLSDLDGTAPSVLQTGGEFAWDGGKVDSSALNLVSWKLDVNARAEDGVEKRGFNAISTVLNHPTEKANPLRSSRKPLPPLAHPSPVIPRPPPASHYDGYLKSITPLYESFVSSQASSSIGPFASSGDSAAGPSRPRTDLPLLESVPDLFFDPSFDLANPSTWSAVVDDHAAGCPTSTDAPQDSLSSHLDTLERHLIHEITLRSSAFFSALSNLQDLHSESAFCLSRISELQTSLRDVGSRQAQKGLDIIESQERLRVLRETEQGLKTVADLDELIKVAKGLVDAGDWANGLSCLSDVVRWWERHGQTEEGMPNSRDQDPPATGYHSALPALPLSTLPALASLPGTLNDLTVAIAAQLEAGLSSLLLSLLSGSDASSTLDEDGLRGPIESMLTGLAKCGKLDVVEEVWRDVLTSSIREGSRKHLPVSVAEDVGDEEGRPPETRGANLGSALKGMDHSRFLLLCTEMFGSLLSRLRLAQQIGEQLTKLGTSQNSIAILSISFNNPDPAPPRPPPASSLDLTDVLASACELANLRASKILAVRAEQHAELPFVEFVEVFKENWDFVIATEKLANRMIVSLRGVTASQARTFLVNYHSSRLTKSAKLVEEEQWSNIEPSSRTQRVVDLIIESAVADPPECFIPRRRFSNGNGENGVAVTKMLSVEEKTFYVVKATAESLELLGDYLQIVVNLELVVTDVMSRIIEFLKSFNSRTCQVVLGAGAMRSAGLKNITAKHLALASQSLSVVVALIPYVREFIRRHLNAKQAVMLTEFDKLKRDYQEHQNEIHSKLVAIMSDRLAVHRSSLRAVDWEAISDREGTNGYAELLVKETATLQKVLSKYLAASTVEGVMSEVLAAIVHRLSEEYGKIELKSEDAKNRMTTDVTFIVSKLWPLSEAGKSVTSLETLVKDKPTPRRPMGQAMKGFMKRMNTAGSPKNAENGKVEDQEEAERKSGDDLDEDGPIVEAAKTDEGQSKPNLDEGALPILDGGNGNSTTEVAAPEDSVQDKPPPADAIDVSSEDAPPPTQNGASDAAPVASAADGVGTEDIATPALEQT